MTDKHVKIFLMVTTMYFVSKDMGAVILYSRRSSTVKCAKFNDKRPACPEWTE